MDNHLVSEPNQDSKNLALLIWIGTLFFGIIPGLVMYLVKSDDDYIQDQSKEAINWSITTLIGYLVGFVLSFIVIGVLVFPVIAICNVIFCVLGAIATSKGNQFRVPYAIRLIK